MVVSPPRTLPGEMLFGTATPSISSLSSLLLYSTIRLMRSTSFAAISGLAQRLVRISSVPITSVVSESTALPPFAHIVSATYPTTGLEERLEEKSLAPHSTPVSYTHLRAHETRHDLVCRLLLDKK